MEPETEAAADEKPSKKKKKKEKRVQPAQIIGRVELKKEPEPQPEPPKHPPRERPRPMRPPQQQSSGPAALDIQPGPPSEDKRSKKKKDKKRRDTGGDKVNDERGMVKRRKEVLLKQDLYDERRGGRLRPKGKKQKPRKTQITTPKASKRRIKLPEMITVANLAHRISVKASEVIQYLISQGVIASMNETVDYDTACLVAGEFGFEAETAEHSEQDLLPTKMDDLAEDLINTLSRRYDDGSR